MSNIRTLSSKNFSNLDTRLLLSIVGTASVSLAPSQSQLPDGTLKFSRLSLNSVSRFPRDRSENFVNQETILDFQEGLISGGYKTSSTFNKYIPTSGKSVCAAIQIDESDRLKITYGVEDTLANCRAAASKCDTSNGLVKYDASCAFIWICVLTSANGTSISPITSSDIFDLRVFTNLAAPKTANLQNKHDSGTVGPRHIILQDVSPNETEILVSGYTKFQPNETFVLKSRTTQTSTAVEQSLYSLDSNGSWSLRFPTDTLYSRALRKSDGTDWIVGGDFNYGDDLKLVPSVGNKLYGSADGITLYNDFDGQSGGYGSVELSVEIPDLSFRARDLSSYSTYIPNNREVAIDPDTGVLKFGSDIYLGDGRHGDLTLNVAGTYSLNQDIFGTTYCRSRKVSGLVKKFDRVIPYSGTDLSVIAGDVVLIYTAQISSDSSLSKVGNYSLMGVVSSTANQITVSNNISHNQIGSAFEFDGVNDAVFVMTIPQFNNVTIGSGVTLTCDAYSPTNGFGVLSFFAKGTVSTQGTISARGKGYAGATAHGGAGQSYLINGYNQVRSTAVDTGGAGGVFGSNGVDGIAGQSSGSGSSFTAVGGTGGGSGGTGGGAGGGGGYADIGGTGSVISGPDGGGVAGAGGGGGGATSVAISLPSGTSTNGATGDSGSGPFSGANGGAAGSGLLTAGVTATGGVGGGLATPQSLGGAGGFAIGSVDIVYPIFGGGGGAAGKGGNGGKGFSSGGTSDSSAGASGGGFSVGNTPSSGVSVGGSGGGLVLILADTVSNLNVNADGLNGSAGAAGVSGGNGSNGTVSGSASPLTGSGVGGHGAGGSSGGGGGGGGGAGGTILLYARSVSSLASITSQGGSGGAGGASAASSPATLAAISAYASAGGGGAGGASTSGPSGGVGSSGRIRMNYFYYSGFYLGDGRNGNLTLSTSGTSSLNQAISGVTYCRSRRVSNLIQKYGTVINYTGSDISVSAGDIVVIYTAQGSSSKVGNYSLLKVVSATANQITVFDNISHNQIGTAFSFDGTSDAVFVMTVPQFNNVTLSNGAVLTCDEYNSTNGFGIVAFLAKGTVSTTTGASISADGKGFSGGTILGAAGQGWGGSFNALRSSPVDTGGGGGTNGVNGVNGLAGASVSGSRGAFGGHGGGSGGTGGGAGGGGGYDTIGSTGGPGGTAGAGGGGGGAANSLSASVTSTFGGNGNDGGSTSGANGGTAGTATLISGSGASLASGGAGRGLATLPGFGGIGGLNSISSADALIFGGGGGAAGRGGAGGNGGNGLNQGGSAFGAAGGSGAGGASSGLLSSSLNVVGGRGGGAVLIYADTSSTLIVTSRGFHGADGESGLLGGVVTDPFYNASFNAFGGSGAGGSSGGSGGAGGGAGGTVVLSIRKSNTSPSISTSGGFGGGGGSGAGRRSATGPIQIFGAGYHASTGGMGGASTSGSAGGTGSNGRVRLSSFAQTYSTSNYGFFPAAGSGAAALLDSTPTGFLGKILRIDENRYIRGTYNYYDETTDFDTKAEVCRVLSSELTTFGSVNDAPATRITLNSPLKLSHTCPNAATIYRSKQSVSVDAILEKYNSRIIFDSGFIQASAGTSATLKHGVILSLSQFTPLVLIQFSNTFTSYDDLGLLYNCRFVNGNEVVGVFLDIQDTTVTYTVGQTALYSFVTDPTNLTSGYIRILFIRN
jgi:hypothetical protein